MFSASKCYSDGVFHEMRHNFRPGTLIQPGCSARSLASPPGTSENLPFPTTHPLNKDSKVFGGEAWQETRRFIFEAPCQCEGQHKLHVAAEHHSDPGPWQNCPVAAARFENQKSAESAEKSCLGCHFSRLC